MEPVNGLGNGCGILVLVDQILFTETYIDRIYSTPRDMLRHLPLGGMLCPFDQLL